MKNPQSAAVSSAARRTFCTFRAELTQDGAYSWEKRTGVREGEGLFGVHNRKDKYFIK